MERLRVTITTWFKNGKYRNNVVEIPMVDGMVELILKNNMNIARKSVAEYLAKNQSADVELIDGNNVIQGMLNIDARNTQEDVWAIDKSE